MSERIMDHEAWPARAALLAALGAVLGLAFDLVLSDRRGGWSQDALRMGTASFILVGSITFAFTLERARWLWSALFGLGCGLVVGLVFLWNGTPSGWTEGDQWRIVSALLAVAIAAPLFQAFRDEGRWRLAPEHLHASAWTNLVLWAAVCAFSLLSFLLGHLLAELFHLIGIDLLRDAMRESWFALALVGAAFGAATGLLRDRDKVLRLLQHVVTTVLSVLAPVLAAGLGLFVLALPITGLEPLWDKTSATTPILLVAIAGAFFLANAVIGNSPEEEAKARMLRASAMVLAAVMTPLAAVAAVSTWIRIDQHGLTPERLWALVFVTVVFGIALVYLWVLVRGRGAWAERARPANVRLAIAICAVALLLATPLFNFGAISTRDQLARLQSGQVSAERFDWAALRFDFGPAGRRALERLAEGGPTGLRARARSTLLMTDRWAAREQSRVGQQASEIARTIRVLPRQVAVPETLLAVLASQNICGFRSCTLFWEEGAAAAVAVGFPCDECQVSATRLERRPDGLWQAGMRSHGDITTGMASSIPEQCRAMERGEVEVRTVTRNQVFVGGRPVGMPFE